MKQAERIDDTEESRRHFCVLAGEDHGLHIFM